MATIIENIKVTGEQLYEKVKELIKEGNIRKITILNKEEKEILSFPMTLGVVGILIAPVLAAVGAAAALITDCTITVEREVPDDQEPENTGSH